uniref:Uncharacterized protein n=1 Tax=Globisporangium ultimum (strain ATCC 200006 / CBS 805.95 / DAOM BR144) TaxID=431595 RepID=K3WYP9_GLOUD
VRKARAPRRRVASAAKAAALPRRYVAKRTPSTSSVDVATAAGKKRKRKTPELVDQSFVWSQVPTEGERPSERYDCGFAMFEDKLIVVGGIVGNQRLNDLYLLDALESPPRWVKPPVTGTPPPTGSLLQTFVIGGMLYVIGGTTDGKFLNELHAINLKSGEWKWERLAIAGQPPSMRYWYSVSVLDGMAILYGGYGHPKRLSDTFALRFDTEVPTWMEMHPGGDLPGPCSTHSVCVYVNKMYIFGGYDGKSRRSQLHALTIDSKSLESIDCTWEQVSTLGKRPSPRYTHSSASIGSKMIVYGGNSGCLKGDVHILEFENVELPTWKLVRCDHAPLPREWHRAVVHNDAMYVFGGHTSEGNENKLFALTAKPAASA